VVPGEVVVDLAPQTAKLRASTLDNSAVAHDLVGRFIGPTTAVFAPTTGLVSSAAASRAIASLSDELSLCDDLLRSSDSGVVRCSPN
jgi:hypothetical protein